MTKKVTIGGQEYPCVLTIGVLKKFKDKTGKDLQDMKDVFSICTLLFMAAVASCQKEKLTFPWDSAEALMDDIELSEIETITNQLFGVVAPVASVSPVSPVAAASAASPEKKTIL